MVAATRVAKKTTTAKKTAVTPKKRTVRVAKTVADEIHAYIPDRSVAQRYVGRKVFGVYDLVIADQAVEGRRNILLQGPTGAGKTLFGEAYASHYQRMYYSLPCDVSIDPSSLFGRMQPTDVPGKFEWQDGPVTQVVRNGGVLNISEVNFMSPKITASLYPLLDGRRYIPLLGHKGEIVRAHPNLLIIADMNPNYRGTMELNEAFKNRFYYKLPWDYDTDVEEKLVKFPTMREVASMLREMTTDIRTPVSTNMLMEFEEIAMNTKLGLEFAAHNFASAFRSEEQPAVVRVMELNNAKIEKDMKFIITEARRAKRGGKAVVDDDDLEEIEFEQEEES